MWLRLPHGMDLKALPVRVVEVNVGRRDQCEPGDGVARRCDVGTSTSRRIENPGITVTAG